MRKLASIKEITDISPILNADFIEVVEVDYGWKCVVKKGEFSIGDLCVYFEIDSFLPIIPEFEFLRGSSFKRMGEEEGFRLRTVKLRKQISQGLAMPLSSLSRFISVEEKGLDLTEAIGVQKYEPPIPANISGEVVGLMPSFIKKTDQERIQNLWGEYRNYPVISSMTFEATIKLDGTSMTVFVVDDKYGHKSKIGVCGRKYEYKETEKNTRWKVARENLIDNLEAFYNKTGRSLAFQGELMGPGIQKNREKLRKHEFFLYEIWDIDKQRYLTPEEREHVLFMFDNIREVPFIEDIQVFKVFNTLQEILDYAEGKSLNALIREGVVFKSRELLNGSTVSFKAISNTFLLKGGD